MGDRQRGGGKGGGRSRQPRYRQRWGDDGGDDGEADDGANRASAETGATGASSGGGNPRVANLLAPATPGHTVDPSALGRIMHELPNLSVADTDRVARTALMALGPGARSNILAQFGVAAPPRGGGNTGPGGGAGGAAVREPRSGPTISVTGKGTVETRVFDACLNRVVATSDAQEAFSAFQKAHPKAFAKGAEAPPPEVVNRHKAVADALTAFRANRRAELLRGDGWDDMEQPVFEGPRVKNWLKPSDTGYTGLFHK